MRSPFLQEEVNGTGGKEERHIILKRQAQMMAGAPCVPLECGYRETEATDGWDEWFVDREDVR